MSLAELTEEYRRRCAVARPLSAAATRHIRKQLMSDAGQLSYDYIAGEFRKLADRLEWPAKATLKDLRHLFATCLEDAGMPEFYRRYFMGQSFGRTPIVVYTHLTEEKLQQHFERALGTELAPIIAAVEARLASMAMDSN